MDYFYQAGDRFSKTISGASLYEISEDGLNVIKLQENGNTTFPSIFGEKLIESMDNNTIYSWTFRITKSTLYFAIGISSQFVPDYGIAKDTYIYNGCAGCLRCHGGDRMWDYGPEFEAGDKVEMIFDAGIGHLSFIINDKPITKKSVYSFSDAKGVAFGVTKGQDLKYRMGVSVSAAGDGCQLIAFNQTDS